MSKIERFLRHGNPENVMSHIPKMRDPAKITIAFQHDKPEVRYAASEALGKLGPEHLAKLLAHHHPEVFGHAERELIRIGSSAAPHVAKMLENDEHHARWYAAYILGKIGPTAAPFAKNIAEHALTHKNWHTATTAAKALEEIGNPEVLPQLQKALESEKNSRPREPVLRVQIRAAIAKLKKKQKRS
ncbi:MAG TPA: HEAT repeat domain-containing protein [Candidatus Norongarragalinales archaeon]|jgi:HEAT repeat protein|nr:HEAT repeat domain-containing protein [Candidatus Norongarragalinales archaeon]